jgi:hypothetical protein
MQLRFQNRRVDNPFSSHILTCAIGRNSLPDIYGKRYILSDNINFCRLPSPPKSPGTSGRSLPHPAHNRRIHFVFTLDDVSGRILDP